MKVKIKGLNSWQAATAKRIKDNENDFKKVVRDVSYKIERTAKQLAPVDTGHLRNNIKTTFEDDGFTGIVSANANYSIYVEYGTRKMAAQPFMTPAAFKCEPALEKRVKEKLRND